MFIQINQESVYGANFSMRGTFFYILCIFFTFIRHCNTCISQHIILLQVSPHAEYSMTGQPATQ